jgi:predicted nicotinamide N-methyase
MPSPIIHRTPPEAFGRSVRDRVQVCGRTFVFDRPAYAADEYIPYWADLWPAAVMLAEAVLAEPWEVWPDHSASGSSKLEALEFGCGLGVSGMAALSRGLAVTFSDVDEAAVQLAAANARLNGFTDFETAALDIRAAPPQQYPVLLAADVCYEVRLTEAVAKFVKAALAPGGLALLTDTDRYSARGLRDLLEEQGLHVIVSPARAGEPGSVSKGFLYRITHRQPNAAT